MKEAYFYKKLEGDKAQCQTCSHYCLLNNGQSGKCNVRINQNGVIYSLVYGKPCAIHIDPIEKKPLYHFLTGTKTLSIATYGCNFCCSSCFNWQISQASQELLANLNNLPKITPEKIIETAKDNNLPSISYTYTEPTIFLEYALDIMKLAQVNGIKNIWVSNGFFSKEALAAIAPYLDAANIDLKSFDEEFYQQYCSGNLKPVLENIKALRNNKIHLEITTLIIPGLNDKPKNLEKIANFIKNELGKDTPWHISKFFAESSYKLNDYPDTSDEALLCAKEIGKKAGLAYIHIGNASGLD